MEEDHHCSTLQLQGREGNEAERRNVLMFVQIVRCPRARCGHVCVCVFVLLTVCMKQCSLSSLAYSTPSLMKTEIALRMNDTKRFMWMKFLVQCSFLCRTETRDHADDHGNVCTVFIH